MSNTFPLPRREKVRDEGVPSQPLVVRQVTFTSRQNPKFSLVILLPMVRMKIIIDRV